MRNKRSLPMLAPLLGASFGGLGWIVLLGLFKKLIFFVLGPILAGLICVVTGLKLFHKCPDKRSGIVGLALLWIIVTNLFFINLIYMTVPEAATGIAADHSLLSLPRISMILALFSLFGFRLVVKDIQRTDHK